LINKINFAGRVIWADNTRNLASKEETDSIRQYTMDNNCDVIVCNRDYYQDNVGKYKCIVIKGDSETGTNNCKIKIIDFKHPEKNKEKKIDFNI